MVLSSLGIPCLDAKVRTGGRLVSRAGTMRATSILKPANRRSAACDAGDRPDVPVKLTDSRILVQPMTGSLTCLPSTSVRPAAAYSRARLQSIDRSTAAETSSAPPWPGDHAGWPIAQAI